MRFNHVLKILLPMGLTWACKPASFSSVEEPQEEAASSEDASGALGTPPVDDATGTIENPTEMNPPTVVPPPPADPALAMLACADAKAKGTLKTMKIPLLFPAHNQTCEFEKNDNLSRKNEYLRARREESKDLPLSGVARLCSLQLEAPPQAMKFDDEIVLTLNGFVLASSQDFSTASKDKFGKAVYSNGLSIDNEGIVSYKWLGPNGIQNLAYHNGKLSRYCLGLDAKSADFDLLCKIPQTDSKDTMQLKLPQAAFLKLANKAGLVFDKNLQQLPKASLGFVTIGDNDDSDCQHLDFQMAVDIEYIETASP